jgi:hypothetical protein
MVHQRTADAEEAHQLSRSGIDVVLVVAPGAAVAEPPGPGRVAVLVGDPADPATQAAAAEMEVELFGRSAPAPGVTP